jgi:hypothetical protein
MKSRISTIASILIAGLLSLPAWAGGGLSQSQYKDQFTLHGSESPHWPDVKACINAWEGKSNPFRNKKNVQFRIMSGTVKVFGLGGGANDNTDKIKTAYPQLIFIKSAVNVMGKSTFRLMNPNGWYCFEDNVNVLGKAVVEIGCETNVATTSGSTTVMGASRGESGVTVLGKTDIKRICK